MSIGEAIGWVFDFSDIGTPASITSFLAYDATGADVSGATLSGAASIVSDTVVGKLFTPATAQTYRLNCLVVISGNSFMGILDINVVPALPTPVTVTNGYCTVAELRRYVAPNAQGDYYDDVVLGSIIEAASRYIDGHTGRTFYARTETHYYDTPDDRHLYIWDDDLLTVTSVTNGDATVITVADYKLYPINKSPKYEIRLDAASSYIWELNSSSESESAITIVGTWGYSATAPADIKSACLQIASAVYKRRYGENTTGTATVTGAGVVIMPTDIPTSANILLEPYRRIV